MNIYPTSSPDSLHRPPPTKSAQHAQFWHDRFVEGGLVLAMALYYLVGNPTMSVGPLSRLNPVFSLPFLLVFAALCWYRLPFAVALLPLTLPYYLHQKVVFSHYAFSLTEITLWTCVVVACLRAFWRRQWQTFSWSYLREHVGPFAIPMLIFFAAAAISIVVAVAHNVALRAFREEVLDPFVYLVLAVMYLRTRTDLARLLGALLASGFIVALLGMAQFFFFKNLMAVEDGVRRVNAVYGSANSIGLFFDYVLPIGLALLIAGAGWRRRALAGIACVPMLYVLYLTDSRGAWIAIALATLFIIALMIRKRSYLLLGGGGLLLMLIAVLFFFHNRIFELLVGGHTNAQGVSTVTKRIYLWQSALSMIHDRPWFGFGMDNWLCYYSKNSVCQAPVYHYWILNDPVTEKSTGLLSEPTLSHPHNIFLHVWVSMGIFGLLGFIAVLVLFYILFSSVLGHVRRMDHKQGQAPRWMVIGVGAAMLAALVQGQVDSSFLEQDLAFCFWMLVAALLIVRALSATPWRALRPSLHSAPVVNDGVEPKRPIRV